MPSGGFETVIGVAFSGFVDVEAVPGFRRQVLQVKLDQEPGRGAGQRGRADLGSVCVDEAHLLPVVLGCHRACERKECRRAEQKQRAGGVWS